MKKFEMIFKKNYGSKTKWPLECLYQPRIFGKQGLCSKPIPECSWNFIYSFLNEFYLGKLKPKVTNSGSINKSHIKSYIYYIFPHDCQLSFLLPELQ